MEHINFFSHEKISDRLVLLNEGYSMVHRFTIGCIIGDEKIMIIDAGLGMVDDFRQYIESVVGTEKPFLLACTHLHPDHVGSAIQFEERYCSHLDQDNPNTRDFAFSTERRFSDLQDFALDSKVAIEYCREHMIQDNRCEFKDIKDGGIFDLGGVKIEAIAVPGHSAGSMAFYNREENYCFTGDAVNTDTHLKKMNLDGFRQYKKTMENFISRVDEKVTLYPAHLPMPMTIEVAKNLVQICDDIVEGRNIDRDPMGETIFHGRQNNRSVRMHYVNNTCIVYNRDFANEGRKTPVVPSENLNFYSHEKWTDRIYTVTINYSMVHRITLMVIIGDEKIMCIDSGHGIDYELINYIRTFAGQDKPIFLACTHVGIDHAGGAIQFDEFYIHKNDWASLERCMPRAKRLEDCQPFSLYNQEFYEYTEKHMCEAANLDNLRELKDGDIFDLGGIQVECIFTPGHSKGHMSFYMREANIAFTGDGMNIDTHLKALNRQGMRDYVKMLEHFMSLVNEDTMIFSSHLNRPHDMSVPRNIAAACQEIADGDTKFDPPGEAIQKHLASYNNPAIKMHYHGNCCVVYDSSKMTD
ncbi:MAG: MBL fold metallo-hydrolase [Clostridiales bacterium]|nr:MBL fold metallo-hydrolase [Clostridiales bacterium]